MDIPQERKLVTEVPGPKSIEWFSRRAAAVPAGVANIHPVVTARASGAIIEDVDGNRLIDFATGIAVLNIGHAAPEVVAAVQRQAELDTHTCFHVTANEPYIVHDTDADERKAYGDAAGVAPEDMGFELFRVDLDQVVAVHLNDEKNALVIASWRPGRGLIRTLRD